MNQESYYLASSIEITYQEAHENETVGGEIDGVEIT